ncbi:MAG: ABC transporter ATP-binding protein, partial [Acidobacteriota bacterium]
MIAQVTKLGRSFGRRHALYSIDFTLERGQIMALVGPNGSGKTTLLKILAGLLRPSWGSAQVLGLDPFTQRARVMQRARFAFAPPPLYDTLTAREHLQLLSSISNNGAPRPSRREIEKALLTVGLMGRADDRAGTFSFGMRQRLVLAQALLPLPELLVLDEPTDGLDPLAVLELRAVLKRLREEQGVTILLSSHLLIEVEKLVDRMLVLEEGRVIFRGRPTELRQEKGRLRLVCDEAQKAADLLKKRGFSPQLDGPGVVYLPGDGSLSLQEASRLLQAEGLELKEFHRQTPTLEQALLER